MSQPVVSVVIVNWNTRVLLRRCLESLSAETRTPCEIWVVDNGSTDGSPEMVASDCPDVQLVANDRNLGFAAANNLALAQARGRYQLLLNSDTIVLDGAVDRMVSYLETHPELSAIGCQLLNADGSLQPSAHNFYSTWGSLVENKLVAWFWRTRSPDTRFLSYWDHAAEREVDWVTGACLMVRAEVVAQVGLLDERFFMYGEEIDWQLRMRQAGYRVGYFPGARLVHYGGASSAQVPQRMRRQEVRSRYLLIAKHYGPVTRVVFRAKTLLALLFWTVVTRLGGRPLKWSA